jgi:POT family proton-dependent oligopeptide transporter
MSTNLVSQAATMETHGMPNDVIAFLNPVSVIVFLPLAQYVLYPALRRAKITFSPINRMALGFLFEAFAQAYAAGLQKLIYSSAPCYSAPLNCAPSPGPNHVNVFAQTPIYLLEGLGEVFSSPGAYEYAYAAAPPSMKSLLQAVLVGMGALAVLLGLALSPLYRDPLLVASYAVLAGAMGVTTGVYWVLFRKVVDSVPAGGAVGVGEGTAEGNGAVAENENEKVEEAGGGGVVPDSAPTIPVLPTLPAGV